MGILGPCICGWCLGVENTYLRQRWAREELGLPTRLRVRARTGRPWYGELATHGFGCFQPGNTTESLWYGAPQPPLYIGGGVNNAKPHPNAFLSYRSPVLWTWTNARTDIRTRTHMGAHAQCVHTHGGTCMGAHTLIADWPTFFVIPRNIQMFSRLGTSWACDMASS